MIRMKPAYNNNLPHEQVEDKYHESRPETLPRKVFHADAASKYRHPSSPTFYREQA